MPNITISLDDEIYRRCCVRAQVSGRSVEEIVAAWLTDWAGPPISEEEQELRKQEFFQVLDEVRASAKARWDGSPRPAKLTRDELHDRNALR